MLTESDDQDHWEAMWSGEDVDRSTDGEVTERLKRRATDSKNLMNPVIERNNLKTAAAIGVTLPRTLWRRADRVTE